MLTLVLSHPLLRIIEIHVAWEDATFFGHYCNKSESTLGEYKYIETDKEKHGVGL